MTHGPVLNLYEYKKRVRSLKQDLVNVSWNPIWEPEELQNTCKSFRRSLQMYKEHITAPNLPQPASDTHLDDRQKQGFSANLDRNSNQPYDNELRKKVNFCIHSTSPQADIVATGRCKY
jgi:hypothetical protein